MGKRGFSRATSSLRCVLGQGDELSREWVLSSFDKSLSEGDAHCFILEMRACLQGCVHANGEASETLDSTGAGEL